MWKRIYLKAAATGLLPILMTNIAVVSRSMATNSNRSVCVKLGPVHGHEEKMNDVLLCAGKSSPIDSHVIFFGGDVQDYRENMESHPMHQQYIEWNLEETAGILQKKYQTSMIWVVRPNSMSHHTFSVFSSFLATIFNGSPDESVQMKGQGSWFHLKYLFYNAIENGVEKIRDLFSNKKNTCQTIEEKDCTEDPTLFQLHAEDVQKLPIYLIGFSKGCVVLNQLLYDLQQALDDEDSRMFIKQINKMIWLDGGHANCKNTWVTQKDVLSLLKETNIKVQVDVTPYQVQDTTRKWIGREQRQFTAVLRKLGIPVQETLHFEELEASLENHFKVLKEF